MALVKPLLWVGGTGGIAYLLMVALTPKDTDLKKLLPEGRLQHRPDSAQRAAIIEVLKKAANVKDQNDQKPIVVEK